MKIIADSGSTKTQWIIISDNKKILSVETAGINAAQMDLENISRTINEARLLLNCRRHNIGEIRFYGAGCIGGEANKKITTAISDVFNISKITVGTDLELVATQMLGKKKGIAAILGTGANTGLWDGSKFTKNVRPMGYILGDECSGAYIGKQLVKLWQRGLLHPSLNRKLNEFCRLPYHEIIERIYRQPQANKFLASFMPFVIENLTDPQIKNMVYNAIEAFYTNFITEYEIEDKENTPIAISGGVAFRIAKDLTQYFNYQGYNNITIKERPLD